MGAKGIKRRKPYRKLPPAGKLPSENDLIPPHIMWPDKGSGFEADPFSPVGNAQRSWWAMNALRRRNRTADTITNVVAWLLLACLAYCVISTLFA